MGTFTLHTRDAKGAAHSFEVEEEEEEEEIEDLPELVYRIYSWSRKGHFFEAKLKLVEEGVLQVETVNNYGIPEFQAMGIPEALYRSVAVDRQVTVRSSRSLRDDEPPDPKHPEPEFLSPDGQQVWERRFESGFPLQIPWPHPHRPKRALSARGRERLAGMPSRPRAARPRASDPVPLGCS